MVWPASHYHLLALLGSVLASGMSCIWFLVFVLYADSRIGAIAALSAACFATLGFLLVYALSRPLWASVCFMIAAYDTLWMLRRAREFPYAAAVIDTAVRAVLRAPGLLRVGTAAALVALLVCVLWTAVVVEVLRSTDASFAAVAAVLGLWTSLAWTLRILRAILGTVVSGTVCTAVLRDALRHRGTLRRHGSWSSSEGGDSEGGAAAAHPSASASSAAAGRTGSGEGAVEAQMMHFAWEQGRTGEEDDKGKHHLHHGGADGHGAGHSSLGASLLALRGDEEEEEEEERGGENGVDDEEEEENGAVNEFGVREEGPAQSHPAHTLASGAAAAGPDGYESESGQSLWPRGREEAPLPAAALRDVPAASFFAQVATTKSFGSLCLLALGADVSRNMLWAASTLYAAERRFPALERVAVVRRWLASAARPLVHRCHRHALPLIAMQGAPATEASQATWAQLSQRGLDAVVLDDAGARLLSLAARITGCLAAGAVAVALPQDRAWSALVLLFYILGSSLAPVVLEVFRAAIDALLVAFAVHPGSLEAANAVVFHRMIRVAEVRHIERRHAMRDLAAFHGGGGHVRLQELAEEEDDL